MSDSFINASDTVMPASLFNASTEGKPRTVVQRHEEHIRESSDRDRRDHLSPSPHTRMLALTAALRMDCIGRHV